MYPLCSPSHYSFHEIRLHIWNRGTRGRSALGRVTPGTGPFSITLGSTCNLLVLEVLLGTWGWIRFQIQSAHPRHGVGWWIKSPAERHSPCFSHDCYALHGMVSLFIRKLSEIWKCVVHVEVEKGSSHLRESHDKLYANDWGLGVEPEVQCLANASNYAWYASKPGLWYARTRFQSRQAGNRVSCWGRLTAGSVNRRQCRWSPVDVVGTLVLGTFV